MAINAEQPQDPALVTVTTTSAPLASEANPDGESDVLISARASDGSLLWQSVLGNSSVERQPRVEAYVNPVDNELNVVVGATQNASLNHNLDGGSKDIVLVCYSAEGEVLWKRILGNDGNQELIDLQLTDDGTLLVLGLTTAGPSGEGLYGQNPQGNGEDIDAFLTAYSPEGSRLWTHQFGSDDDDIAIEMDLSSLPDLDPATGKDTLTNSIVVAGWRESGPEPIGTPKPGSSCHPSDADSITPALLPPPAPNWIGRRAPSIAPLVYLCWWQDPIRGTQLVSLQGTAKPESTFQSVWPKRMEQSWRRPAAADTEDGNWQLDIVVDGLSRSQLGEALVLIEATNNEGLQSDTLVEPVLLTGSGLPGELPQALPIDPDGPDGDQAPSLLLRQITRLGTGPITTANQRLLVDYTGTFTNGEVFDSSLNPGRNPFELTLGSGRVIKGWDLGLQGLPMGSSVELVIPSELAYGPTGTGSIPGGATLLFNVDLRADLSLPEAFLSQLVWPNLFNADYAAFTDGMLSTYGQDLLQLAHQYGASNGTSSGDDITVIAPTEDWPDSWPVTAMTGEGDDQLSTTQNSAILFGEWGNDSLSAKEGFYAFLDGGEGDDHFETTTVFTWARGGPGAGDTLTLPVGDWELLQQSTYGEANWYELGRFTASNTEGAAPDLTQIIYAHGIEAYDLSSTAFIADFLAIKEDSLFQTFAEPTIKILDANIEAATVLNLLETIKTLNNTNAKTIDISSTSEIEEQSAETLELDSIAGINQTLNLIDDSEEGYKQQTLGSNSLMN